MNDLQKYFAQNTGKLIHKWHHYFEIYDRHFSRFRNTEVNIVEFGVSHGGSLQMWKDYFGPKCRIYGVDINPHCKQLEEERVEIFIGDQENREFLRSLAARIPKIDILIDDGGHTMAQQINTFEELFHRVDERGVYLCEDMHTSYWPKWEGGYRKPGTFVEYSKDFIDYINAWHSMEKDRLDVSDFTRQAHSLHYYDSILVIEKRPMVAPQHSMTGTPQLPEYQAPAPDAPKKKKTLKQRIARLFK